MGRKAKRARLAVRRARLLKKPEPVEAAEKKEVVVEQPVVEVPKPVVEEKPKPAKKTRKAPVRKRTAKKKTTSKE